MSWAKGSGLCIQRPSWQRRMLSAIKAGVAALPYRVANSADGLQDDVEHFGVASVVTRLPTDARAPARAREIVGYSP